MNRTFGGLLLAITILIAPLPGRAEEEVRIGIILPLTGEMAAVGAACRDAARMGLADAERLKRQYRLVFEDDRLQPSQVATAAQKLLSVDKVSAIISMWSYGGRIVSPLAERAGVPHIGIAWDERVADGEFNFLHLTPPSEFMRRFLDAFKKIGVHRVALLGIEESGSVFALDTFSQLAPQYGIEVVFRDSVLWDMNDFDSLVGRIAKTRPQYLLFNLGGQALNAGLLQSLKTLKVPFRFTAITSFDVVEDTRPIEGLWYVSDSYLPEEFAERFRSRFGHTIRYGVGNLYEAVRLFIQAFEQAKAASPREAKDLLLNVRDQASIFGPTSADRSGVFTYPAQYMRIENGKRVPIRLEAIYE